MQMTDGNNHPSFQSDNPGVELKGKSLRGVSHVVSGRAGLFILNIASTIVLARLLTPFDFGLVAVVLAVTAFVQVFKDLGLSAATIQRSEISHAQISTLFWINMLLSFVVAVTIIAIAPAVAWFYGRQEMVPVMGGVAVAALISGAGVQHNALLVRSLRLDLVNIAAVVAELIGFASAVAMAVAGAGYWALVGKSVIVAGCTVVLVWTLSGWRPGLPARGSGVRSLIKFGGKLTVAQIIWTMVRKVDDICIGWFWGATNVGYYSRAYGLLMLPTQQLTAPLASAAIPVLSKLQSDPGRFRRYYLKGIELIASLGYPVVVFLFVAAEEAIGLLLGEQWSPCVAIFRMLGPATLMEVTIVAAGWWIVVPLGLTNKELSVALVYGPLYVAAVVTGLPWGVLGVAAAISICTVVSQPLILAYCYAGTGITLLDFYGSIWRPGIAALVVGSIVFGIKLTLLGGMTSSLTRLILMGTLFGLLYLMMFIMLPGGKARLKELIENLYYLKSSSLFRPLGSS